MSTGDARLGTAVRQGRARGRPTSRSAGLVPFRILVGALTVGVLFSVTLAVMIGSVPIPASEVWRIAVFRTFPELGLVTPDWTGITESIVWDVRFPRVLLGAFVGAGLSIVGATLQAMVRNPLADPYVFGITSGASVGAVAVILLGLSVFGVYSLSIAAFVGALVAFGLVFLLAQRDGVMSPVRLILAGVAISYVLSAITSFMVFYAANTGNGGEVRSVLFWLLGGLGGARWIYLTLPALAVLLGTLYLVLQARSLNALVVGEESAAGLGVDPQAFRRQLFVVTALLTGVLVAVSGGIGFVGLMLPHIVRLMVGADHRRVLPVAGLLGAIFLIWADVLARTIVAPSELPIGIITAFVGAPFSIWLLRRRSVGAVGRAA